MNNWNEHFKNLDIEDQKMVKRNFERYIETGSFEESDVPIATYVDPGGIGMTQWGHTYRPCVQPMWHFLPDADLSLTLSCTDDNFVKVDDGELVSIDPRDARLERIRANTRGTPESVSDMKAKMSAAKEMEKKLDTLAQQNSPSTRMEDIDKNIAAIKAKAGTDLEVRPDVPYTPYINYKRPVESPYATVEIPYETRTGMVMPPLPKHFCELPNAVEAEQNANWQGNTVRLEDLVLLPDGTTYSCVCGLDWYVRVQRVPMHQRKYQGEYTFGWHKIRWYNFNRKADLKRRKEKK